VMVIGESGTAASRSSEAAAVLGASACLCSRRSSSVSGHSHVTQSLGMALHDGALWPSVNDYDSTGSLVRASSENLPFRVHATA
jgi:hypothetical protein